MNGAFCATTLFRSRQYIEGSARTHCGTETSVYLDSFHAKANFQIFAILAKTRTRERESGIEACVRLCEIPSIAAKWQIAASLPAFGGLQQTLVNHRTELPRTLLMWVHFHVGASTRCISQRRECQPGVLGQIPSTYLLKLWIFNWFQKYIVNWQEEKQLKEFVENLEAYI